MDDNQKVLTPVIKWIQYLRHSDSVYSYEEFCGNCGLHLRDPFGSPRTLDEVMDSGDILEWGSDDKTYRYDRFCRHCGSELEPGPWKGEYINIRPVNHLDGRHGYHRGDSHVFAGFQPGGHYLGGTGSTICWCDPIVTAIPDGCEIAHRDIERVLVPDTTWDDDDE